MRVGRVERSTSETNITMVVNLDGTGSYTIDTGVPFLDHMLSQVARHGLLDIKVQARGDVQVDYHHTVEDVGICLGKAIADALHEGAGIRRFGQALAPMDEALVLVALDISGRGYAATILDIAQGKVGDFDTELIPEFLRALAMNGGISLHTRQIAGSNSHHIAEAVFKALGLALRQATEIDPRRPGIPSTKGSLL